MSKEPKQTIKEVLRPMIEDKYGVWVQETGKGFIAGGVTYSFDEQQELIEKELDEALKDIKKILLESKPAKADDKYKFLNEDKSRGWTQEQLTERCWGYNLASDQYEASLMGRLGDDS